MNKLLIIPIIFVLTISIAYSSNAPPQIPTEIWGEITYFGSSSSPDLLVEAKVNNINYAQYFSTITQGGITYYNVILKDSDSPLTFEDDPDCSTHQAAQEECVPCTQGVDCIEGPQDDQIIKLFINNKDAMPYQKWKNGTKTEINLVAPLGDWDKSGCVSTADIISFADHYNFICSNPGWDPLFDLVFDCSINTVDITVFADHYEEGCI